MSKMQENVKNKIWKSLIEVLKDIREAPGKIYVKQVVERIKMIGKPVSVDSGPDKVVFCNLLLTKGTYIMQ